MAMLFPFLYRQQMEMKTELEHSVDILCILFVHSQLVISTRNYFLLVFVAFSSPLSMNKI